MKSLFRISLLATSLACAFTPVRADTSLNMANWLPPSHPLISEVMVPYAESISAATDGRVSINIMPSPIGPPPAHYDFAVNGVADITYGVQAYTPGRFKTSNLAELPRLGDSAEAVSVAYWKTFESLLQGAGEYDQVKVLAVFTHGPGHIFTSRPELSTLADIKGAKLRVAGGIAHDVSMSLEAVPVEGPSSQAYEMLSQKVVDGIMFPFESVSFFNLIDLLESSFQVPGGLYNTSFFVVMNKRKWETLSAEDQSAIDAVSGETLARMAGKMWDEADAAGLGDMQGKIKTTTASEEQLVEIDKALQPVVEKRMAEIEEAGINAENALEMLKSEIAKH